MNNKSFNFIILTLNIWFDGIYMDWVIVLIIIISVLLLLGIAELLILGIEGGIGPLKKLRNIKMAKLRGNANKYHLKNLKIHRETPIKNKKLLFLGSSVTNGAASLCVSMADYIRVLDEANVVKEAVNGTTLCEGPNSYFNRLKKIDINNKFDAVIVQLSTNDATQKKPLGILSSSKDPSSFDNHTIIGSIESIICYSKEKWNCPVIFYTGTKFDSDLYQKMVDFLYKIQEKWGILILDLWNDKEMNSISKDKYKLYMHDQVHPTQAGYLEWWTPKFEEKLIELFNRK